MSLADELLADLNDISDDEIADAVHSEDGDDTAEGIKIDKEEPVNGTTENTRDVSSNDLVSSLDSNRANDIRSLCNVLPSMHRVVEQVRNIGAQSVTFIDRESEYDFLVKANDVCNDIIAEINLLHNYVSQHYNNIFPELESLLPDPLEYCKTVLLLSEQASDTTVLEERLKEFLTNDKILLVTMSASLHGQKHFAHSSENGGLSSVFDACRLLRELDESQKFILAYTSSRLALFCPNVSTLVGPVVAAQLMSVAGGIRGLAQTPSCNISSLGSKKNTNIGFGQRGFRQQGFLYHSDLVQGIPDDSKKQAMRILSGKLVLAARIDASYKTSIGSNANGLKWREEIAEKLAKLQMPPEQVKVKALPIPMDRPSKKRGGRRFRKFKEQFEMSDIKKAQNKMAFGQQEETYTDAFGQDIGMGMIGSSGAGVRGAAVNTKNKPKVTKSMQQRLQNSSASAESGFLDFENPETISQIVGSNGKRKHSDGIERELKRQK